MAIAFVQAATGSVSVASSGTAVWGGNTTTGNTIVVAVLLSSGSQIRVRSVTDSQGNLYKSVAPIFGSSTALDVWVAENITGGTTPTITANLVGSVSGGIIAREYSGLGTVSTFDTASKIASGSSSTPASNTTPIATRTGVEVAVAYVIYTTGTPTLSLGSGYANLTLLTGGGSTRLAAEDKILSVTGAQSATFGSNASGSWSCIVATFADRTLPQSTQLNNFQFGNSGDGMSVTEKIR